MNKGLEEARRLDQQERAAKKRGTKKRAAKKSPAKAKKRAAKSSKRRVVRKPKLQVLKLSPDVEITMKSGKYKLVQVREDHPAAKPTHHAPKRRAPKRPAAKCNPFPFTKTKKKKTTAKKKRRKTS